MLLKRGYTWGIQTFANLASSPTPAVRIATPNAILHGAPGVIKIESEDIHFSIPPLGRAIYTIEQWNTHCK